MHVNEPNSGGDLRMFLIVQCILDTACSGYFGNAPPSLDPFQTSNSIVYWWRDTMRPSQLHVISN